MLLGGQKIEDTPQFRNALEERQRVIRKEYDEKMQEIEKERIQIEEDKQQVDRYKSLLLKQRDIMIALTGRLNERDETIIQLQEELDAWDRITRETEVYMEHKNQRIEQLEQYIRQDCKREVPAALSNPPVASMGMHGLDGEDHMPRSMPAERKYQPHSEWSGLISSQNGQGAPLMLMTADEKVAELQQMLEARTLENDELRVALNSPQSTPQRLPSAEIMHHIKAAMQDLSQMQSNPQQYVQQAAKKLQGISSLLQGNQQAPATSVTDQQSSAASSTYAMGEPAKAL